ncbi:MAG: hypothetical protein WCX31_06690 [Salinivirgaceae bacterium]
MKQLYLLIASLLFTVSVFSQKHGISYQAVIIDPNAQEIPGVDKEGNILPNTQIAIRFTILDATNAEEFTEVQITNTDRYGMINLIIGHENFDDFTRISWDGTQKDLKVDIDFTGVGDTFVDLSRQDLTFAPYAYHRNITATGTLRVDDNTSLNGELLVEGPTNLNSSLDVNNSNNTNLTGMLNVVGVTQLDSNLLVVGKTALMDSLNVNQSPSHFDGNIAVEDTATFNGPAIFNAPVDFVEITVNGPSHLNGQVTVHADMDTLGDKTNYNAYPLLVEGGSQGMAIKVEGSRSSSNNYISFWDGTQMWGRIEGQTIGELTSDPGYAFSIANQTLGIISGTRDFVIAGLEAIQAGIDLTAASTSSTACVGLGACVTAPIPSTIAASVVNLVLKIANTALIGAGLGMNVAGLADFIISSEENIGVTYQSGAGDYAEWLPKAISTEAFLPGEIVGVRNGSITKSTSGADKIMVVSTNPIVLGNMPQLNEEKNYEKIAFMGQVPVRVIGEVEPGDYILPNIFVEGFGTAVHPDDMKIADYKKVAGVAWSVKRDPNYNYVNLAVGLNTNDMAMIIQKQDDQLNDLQEQIDHTNSLLSTLVPGFKEALDQNYVNIEDTTLAKKSSNEKAEKSETSTHNEDHLLASTANDIVYITPTREQLMVGIEQAKAMYLEAGNNLEDHPFWKKMKEEPAYQEEILQLMENKFDKAMHTHKAINQKFAK